MRNERFWNVLGLILGVVVILVGVVFMATPAQEYGTSSPDYASFGADFYSYQYDATRIAANNVEAVADGLRELSAKLALYAGFGFVVAGAVLCLNNGKKLAMAAKEAAPAVISYEIPAEQTEEEAQPAEEVEF